MREKNWIKIAPGKNPQIRVDSVKMIPICINEHFKEDITQVVETILSLKKEDSSADTSALESSINLLVYRLYDLTYDEVLIVDPETPITREEYEKRPNF